MPLLDALAEVIPNLKIHHSTMKRALESMAKLHPKIIANSSHPDLLYGQISLSFRLVLFHFKKCSQEIGAWQTCKNMYKGDLDLEPITTILNKIEPDEEPFSHHASHHASKYSWPIWGNWGEPHLVSSAK